MTKSSHRLIAILVSENKHFENSFILLSKLRRSTRDVI